MNEIKTFDSTATNRWLGPIAIGVYFAVVKLFAGAG